MIYHIKMHNAKKTCWNCPAAKLKGNVDFRACGQTVEKGGEGETMIECSRRPELGHFEPTITFEQCPEWQEGKYGYMLKDMRVMILGIDGYLGWTLALKLGALGCKVSGIDNYLRRDAVAEKGSHTVVPILRMTERLQVAREVLGIDINFRKIDLMDTEKLKEFIEEVKPEAIVHYAEYPSAPYSMVDLKHALKVQENNVLGTLGLLWIMKEVVPEASLIKLGCYDDETEILTEDGWKLFEDLKEGDKVATRSKTDRTIKFKKPNSIHEFDYKGPMYCQQNTRLDFCITPNHRVFTQKRSNTNYKELRLESVQDVEGGRRVYETGFDWEGENLDYFILPAIDGEEPKKIPAELWLNFFGWYISEGCIKKNSIVIKQNKKGEFTEELKNNLVDLCDKIDKPLRVWEDGDCYVFSIFSKQIADYLKKFGKAAQKNLPKEIKGLNKELLKKLLFSLIKGDGWKHNPEWNRNNYRYFTISKKLADDVQEVALKCGYGVLVYHNKKKNGYCVNICQTPRVHVNHNDEKTDYYKDYDGKVWCVNVGGDGIVFVRRNGKPIWSGNTMGEYGAPLTGRPIFEGMFPADSTIKWDDREWSLGGELTPRDPVSFYHCSKVQDTFNVYEACKYWWLRSYDIMQGVIYGVYTEELAKDERLRTRLDMDEWFGTVINRFATQAVIGEPLTIYGGGEQIRGFIALEDAMECMVRLICSPPEPGQYGVVNQVSGVHKIADLAEIVADVGKGYGLNVKINRLENPRVEAEEHPMEVVSSNLPNQFGFKPSVDPRIEVNRMLQLLTRDDIKKRIGEKKHVIAPKTWWSGEKKDSGVLEEYEPGTKEKHGYEGRLDT